MCRSEWHVRLLVLGAALYAFGAVVPNGYAQVPTVTTAITSDGTLGTTIARSGNLYDINGGTTKGTNLFHSFGQFSVGTGDIASFNGLPTIKNILSRVTGGTRSEIDGTLRSTIAGANLWLLNSAGIMFGPNAQLQVSGSFHASTADYVKLGNDGVFYADPTKPTVLSVAPPSAFGFLPSNPNPAPIDVQAGVSDEFFFITNILQVPAEKTLSFVGGPINIGAAPGAFAGGFVFAPEGRINLVSVASPGEARFDGRGFSVDSFARLGDISIKGNGILDAKEVFIRGGRLVIEVASILPGFFGVPPDGGEVNIQVSDSVNIKGPLSEFSGVSGILTFADSGDVPHINIRSSSISLSEGGLVQTVRQGPGNPSNISIEADTVEVLSGAQVNALNFFQGPGGTLSVNARDVTLDSAGSDQVTGLSAQANFFGDYGFDFSPSLQLADSGSITVNATGTLTMRGIAQISTDNFAFGKSGNVTVNAGDMLLVGAGTNTGLISAQSSLAGQSGDVTINATGTIDMQNGFRISANTLGSGDGGQANVKAGRSITMSGNSTFISSVTSQPLDSELDGFAGLFSSFFGVENLNYASLRATLGVTPSPNDLMNVLAALRTVSDGAGNPLVAVTDFAPGAGGKVSITTPVLAANNGAHIETSTVWDGNAGAIALDVGSLTLRDGAIIGSRSGAVRPDRGFTVGTGNAGTVNIAATDTIEISGSSPTSGEGSIVTTNTFGDGNAGNISLSANQVNVQNGGIVSSASGGTVDGQLFVGAGNAGQISVSAPTLAMADGTISVATSGAGSAGSILLNGNTLSLTGGSQVVSSTTGAGQGGSVTATATESMSISGGNGSQASGVFSTASSTGNAGQISVSTPTLTMADGGRISVATEGTGNAGNILANVNNFALTGGARIDSSTTGIGAGGAITVTATDGASIAGLETGVFSTASNAGNAGQISVTAPTLDMNNGGTISVATSGGGNAGNISLDVGNLTEKGGARIESSTTSAGQGGSVAVAASGSVSISGPETGLFSTASGTGAGGTVSVQAANLNLLNGGSISASSTGTATATAGNVNIVIGDTLNMENSTITTASAEAAGGNINITSTGSLLHLKNSQITTSVSGGAGGGGNITIGADLVDPATSEVANIHLFDFIVLDNGGIHADSRGGAGGRINIFTDVLLSSTPIETAITSESGVNQPGIIDIQARILQFISNVSRLPEVPLQATELLRATCAARVAAGTSSSLVLGGRGGLPLEPGGLLPSPLGLGAEAAITFSPSNFSILSSDNERPLLRAGWDQFKLAKTALGLDCAQ
jgi:filamentous hemagglutinin family protein